MSTGTNLYICLPSNIIQVHTLVCLTNLGMLQLIIMSHEQKLFQTVCIPSECIFKLHKV